MRFLKKLLLGVYIFLALFSVVTLILFLVTGNEPSTLVASVFGVAGVESMLGAIIKTKENKNDTDNNGKS